ncbi:UDP-3-O-(3-hydroxymyristoyl)glucosamine N-acyltransferase [Candidatus Babeliales bacterium]|nr:UDP-3-O-(3-hydroxymyristoyl)glucosamine N-acyltransferase [Candidatus Babeliales bacterium]
MQLNIALNKLLDIVGGVSDVNPNFFVNKIASLKNATSADVSVVFDPEDVTIFDHNPESEIKLSRAGIILASKAFVEGRQYVLVEDPLEAYHKLTYFAKKRKGLFVDKSAALDETVILEDNVSIGAHTVVERGARIGEGSSVGAQVFIGSNVKIGSNVIIYPGVKILDDSIIGEKTIIHSGVVIGSDGFGYRITKSGLIKVPQIGKVIIGKNVEIGANCCIDKAAFDETVIGDGVKLDNQVHIAHNVHIGAHTAIIAQTAIGGSSRIGSGCMIGGQVAIKDHVTVGNGVKIVSKAGVLKNVPDGSIVAGVPAISFDKWKRISVAKLHLPEIAKLCKNVSDGLSKRTSFWNKIFGR